MPHPYSELIEKVGELAESFSHYQTERDYHLIRFERQKIALLVVLLASVWIMFLLLWNRMDDDAPAKQPPSTQREPEIHYQIRYDGMRGEPA